MFIKEEPKKEDSPAPEKAPVSPIHSHALKEEKKEEPAEPEQHHRSLSPLLRSNSLPSRLEHYDTTTKGTNTEVLFQDLVRAAPNHRSYILDQLSRLPPAAADRVQHALIMRARDQFRNNVDRAQSAAQAFHVAVEEPLHTRIDKSRKHTCDTPRFNLWAKKLYHLMHETAYKERKLWATMRSAVPKLRASLDILNRLGARGRAGRDLTEHGWSGQVGPLERVLQHMEAISESNLPQLIRWVCAYHNGRAQFWDWTLY